MRHAIAQTHLDGCISFLHASTEARHSLALDLAEPFKPVLTDTLIFEAVLRNRMDDTWFCQENGACRLNETGRLRTLEMWSAKVEAADGDERSMRQIMRNEALGIERYVLGLGDYKPFLRMV